ncbi:MAG: hypothetical protein JWP19_2223 [Rhodoglobus sp.]|nr:hypothetical protein [Rhodoglobus sp.]
MTKTTRTNANGTRATRTATKGSDARTALPLTWTATEYVPRKRWCWYVGLGLVATGLAIFAIAIQEWFVLAVIIAATATIFVTYLAKPKAWRYKLTATVLQVGEQVWQLKDYRAFTVEELNQGKRREPYTLIALLPKARFKPARDIYLPGDQVLDLEIVEALRQVLRYEEARSYRRRVGIIDRVARLLRLN